MKKLSYHDNPVRIKEGSVFKNGSCTESSIEGWAWCIFDGYGQWISDDRTFDTELEAYGAAEGAIERWEKRDRQTAKEAEVRNRFMQRTWKNKKSAEEGGCKSPIEYVCHECGCRFWAELRSRYTPVPYCPGCDAEDREMIYEVGDVI